MPTYERSLPAIWFGDGTQGKIYDIDESKTDPNGRPIVQLEILPTKELMQAYGIREADLDAERFTIRKTFPQSRLLPLSGDPKRGTMLCMTGFNRQETRLSRYYMELINAVDSYVTENRTLKAHIAYLQQEHRKIMTQYKMYMKENVDIILTANKARGRDREDYGYQQQQGGGGPQSYLSPPGD